MPRKFWVLTAFVALWVSLFTVSATRAAIPSDVLLEKLQPRSVGNDVSVSDFAGILKPEDVASLQHRISQLRQKNGSQFAVVILPSLEGGQIDDFISKLFHKWRVGEKGKNNGVMLLVALKDRKARIEVGYGLEPVLPDALAGRALDQQLFPAFKQGRYAEGLAQAVGRVSDIIERGVPASEQDRGAKKGSDDQNSWVLLFFVAMGFGAIGAGIGGRQLFPIVFGSGFGGIPMLLLLAMGGAILLISGIGIALVAFFFGLFKGRNIQAGQLLPGGPATGEWCWINAAGGGLFSGSSGSSSDSGFGGGFGGDSGGGFGGFGGGDAGGGGASGDW